MLAWIDTLTDKLVNWLRDDGAVKRNSWGEPEPWATDADDPYNIEARRSVGLPGTGDEVDFTRHSHRTL